MNYNKDHFQAFSNSRLIEIVKHARQFGYDDETRNAALQALKNRGISEEDLQLTGNLTNYKYDYAHTLYSSYTTDSKIAFFSYGALLIFKTIDIFHLINFNQSGLFPLLVNLALLILFLVFLIISFFDHMNFYKAIGKELGLGDQIIFFIIGMPFYIFMYFFYKSQMKEALQMLR